MADFQKLKATHDKVQAIIKGEQVPKTVVETTTIPPADVEEIAEVSEYPLNQD